ncbi:MAG TPA: hypothetical protein VGX21_19625 [Methylomirabilota bacterium]|nr:hypothetical protein [Methylomirabilota bacterium]
MRRRRRGWAPAVLLTLMAIGCAAGPEAPPAARLIRPEWKVGDRWVFRRTPALGTPVFVTHEVMEATPEGYTVRMTRLGQEILRYWTRDLHLARQTVGGQPLNRFEPAARYFEWPLRPGKTWTQEFDYEDGRADGHYTNQWRIAKQAERVDLLAGWFVALKIERLSEGGEPLDTYWYVPELRYWARFTDHANRYTEELVEFAPGSA